MGRALGWSLLLVVLAASNVTHAQNLARVSVIAFPGVGSWPIRVAQEKGYFAQTGIEVTLTPTPNSVFQMTNLIEGKFDIAMTACDNMIAYMEGQGEVPVSTRPDLFIFMGGSPTVLSLVSSPDIKSYDDLRGKTVAVDAVTTGYAFVLFDLLKRQGLGLSDYKVEGIGGTLARWQALRERKVAATLLTAPFNLMAQTSGYPILQYAKDVYGHYEESIATTRRSWAAANEEKLKSYLKAYVAAVEWLRDRQNKHEAIAILRKHFPQISPELGASAYEDFIGPRGVAPKAQLDIAGMRKVLELRSEYGQPKRALTDPAVYYDLKYYEAAIRP